jgi:transposase InsO family protein
VGASFIERLNLTIRRGCSYLARKTTGHARAKRTLVEQLDLFRCYYNFVRPHSSLRFGREVRTPAMQAGLALRRYSFRDIFEAFMPGGRRSGRVVAWSLLSTRLASVPMAA